MLNTTDLKIIRAALRYFADETLPHGDDPNDFDINESPARFYFEQSNDMPSDLNRRYVLQMADRLMHARLRIARCTQDAEMLYDRRLLREDEIEHINLEPDMLIATVLVPGAK